MKLKIQRSRKTFQAGWISLLLVGLTSASLGCDGASGNTSGGEGGGGAAGGNGGAGGLPCVAEDDGNPCTQDLCDSAEHPPLADGSPCSDGDACTQTDTCEKGVCVGANPLVCDPGVVCVGGQCLVTQCQGDFGLPGVPLVPVPGPIAVVLADVDGDGKRDLVSANAGVGAAAYSVSVARGEGDGTFAPRVDYPLGSFQGELPRSFAVADLNGDGRPEIVAAGPQPSHVLTVLYNSGSGTFPQRVEFPLSWRAIAVVAADLDGDGHVDLATGNEESSTVSVLLNDGTGAFPTQSDYASSGFSPVTSLAAADLNGDGHVDLAAVNAGLDTTSVLLNDGAGAFPSATEYPTGKYPQTVAAADLDGDGALDLAVTGKNDGNVRVFRNDGQGLFPTSADYPAGKEPWSVEAADLNGDGKPDLVVTESFEPHLHVLFNDGQGHFPAQVDHPTKEYSRAAAAGDVNGDDEPDLIVTCPPDLSVLQNEGGGAFVMLEEHTQPPAAFFNVAAADLDGNGTIDLAATSDTLQVFLNDGSGALPSSIPSAGVGSTGALQVAELDGDGKPDLFFTGSTSGQATGVGVALNGGGGVFSALSTPVGTTGGVAAADLDGDGLADLAVTDNFMDRLGVYLNQGGGSFAAVVLYETASHPGPIVAADFNGDGATDLAAGTGGRISVHPNLGGGDFHGFRTDYPTDQGPTDIITPDLNGDGKPDLVFVSELEPAVHVWRNDGKGEFPLPLQVAYPTTLYAPSAVRAADMNGDGLLDLVVAYRFGDVGVLLGKGNGQFAPGRDYFVSRNQWNEVPQFAVADLNNDGRQDLAFAAGDALQVLFNRCSP